MQEDTSITKYLGELETENEVTFRLWRGVNDIFNLRFQHRGLGMANKVWLGRDQLRIVSDLLLEALVEDDG